ncbi:sensor histidine kinase [Fictibacillus fluitans]|uniref:Heme sensor protein HssS n=1 Tax=Fictibacillus fluitans TaxID=3058422 RepID=A0ABT8HYX9_9BACL|nr:HAMP domain-containing sensor histidine kinase [Fictibacillus sp. NE201]MDN4525972.1 HAMP domain-containing sensor histidine kinase [Fictibacillus sp. NE201]
MKTLYVRIVVTTIAVMIVSSLLSFVLANAYYQKSLKPYNDQKVTKIAKQTVDYFEKNPQLKLKDYLTHVADTGYQIYMVDQNGRESYYGGDFRKKEIDRSNVNRVLNGGVYHGIAQFPSAPFVTGFFDNVLKNTIGMPLKESGNTYALFIRPNIELQFGEMRLFFSAILLLTIVLSIVLVGISTRYLVKPIVQLTEATKKIATGNYRIKLNEKRRDEIGSLASNFSEMAKSLEQLEEMRQEFVSNVSHEIQSPLASMKGFAQTLQNEQLTPEKRKEYLAIIEKESVRLSQLSKQLLMLASLDKEEAFMEKGTFDVAAQIKEVVHMTEWSWREKEMAIEMDLPQTFIYGDKKLLHQVWTNLITNSIKYTEPGGTVSISLEKNDRECRVFISDSGVGISPQDLPSIFDRFYKADKARERKEGSSGLGLSIVKKIVELHHGEIKGESEPGRGTTFTVSLPKM